MRRALRVLAGIIVGLGLVEYLGYGGLILAGLVVMFVVIE